MCTQSFRSGYVENNLAKKAIDLFNGIKNPDGIIINILFNASAQLRTDQALNLAKKVSEEMPKSFHSDPRLLTSLLDALLKCGDVKHAELLFNTLKKKVLSMYAVITNGFNQANDPSRTFNLFNRMKVDGFVADIIIYLCVIKSLSQLGDYETSQSIVKEISNSFLVDNQIQNALISMWVSLNKFLLILFALRKLI
jgi:pentatricopeptide repeat protein